MTDKRKIFRVLDANLNRLREALRVVEEYYRFIDERPVVCRRLKRLRHDVVDIEGAFDRHQLLANRDTAGDCFAGRNRPEELDRRGMGGLVSANFRRGQEACRAIEEYAKVLNGGRLSEKAKTVRFKLYALEKELFGGEGKRGTRKGG